MSTTGGATRKLSWNDYVKKFFCDDKYVAQPCTVLNGLLGLCQQNDISYILDKLVPQIKVKGKDVTNDVREELKNLSLTGINPNTPIKKLLKSIVDELQKDNLAQNIANKNSLNVDEVKEALKSRLLNALEGTCLYKKRSDFSEALGRIAGMIRNSNCSCGANVNDPKDLICPLILLYLPLVFTSRDLCGEDRTDGIFDVGRSTGACKASISPLSDIVISILQYFRNVAVYNLNNNKVEYNRNAYFPICPSRNDLLLLVLLYIAIRSSQQTNTPRP